jgi:uridylate kinase
MKKIQRSQKKYTDHIDSKKSKKLKYQRIVLKISGETLGEKAELFNKKTIDYIVTQIVTVKSLGVKMGIVVGGGNIMRGREARWLDSVDADYCGMVATVINGIVLQSQLRGKNIRGHLCSGLEVRGVTQYCNKFENFNSDTSGDVLLFVGGTGNPFFTTDTAAALRAVEFGADILIKGTKVDGVYSSDPQKNRTATFYRRLTFDDIIRKKLEIMDLSAFNICKEANIPICVYNFMRYPLSRVLYGEEIGTLITTGG